MSVLQFPQALRQATPEAVDHKLGEYSVGLDGPTIVLIGGVHGNEPAGVVAIRRVLAELHARRLPLRGKVVGLVGNPAALDRGRRFVTRDLNRGWSRPTLSALSHGYGSGREDEAQRGLLHALAPLLDDAKGSPVTFLDLHSISGPGAPFACIADVKRNYTVAQALPIPVILGIEEMLDGSLLGFLCDLGHAGIAIEGGQNDDPSTVLRHEAAAWIAMVATGALRETIHDIETHRRGLGRTAKRLPRFVEVSHRHATTLDDGFVMEPGFSSFEPVRAGEVLAGIAAATSERWRTVSSSCLDIRRRATTASFSPRRCPRARCDCCPGCGASPFAPCRRSCHTRRGTEAGPTSFLWTLPGSARSGSFSAWVPSRASGRERSGPHLAATPRREGRGIFRLRAGDPVATA